MKVEDIFLAALEKTNPAEQAVYLDEVCGGNDQLRRQVEGLIKSHEEAGSVLDQLLFQTGITADNPITERPGAVIGRYKLLEQIGEGGMGVVFMAEQTEPVKRKVALKIIKPGMDTKQVIARFEAERQALALMDHPNISRVLDAGTTVSEPAAQARDSGKSLACPAGCGRPYFVMELVRGIPITEYCDEKKLTTRERLELFVHVCQAVQYAHQKGIIHRDIKPSNVMIAPHDGTPVVKVIDFGVAKATGGQLTDKSLFTGFGQMIGTPLYMSPEQAEINALDVDTRSDIYSLGVLIYELLTGTTSFDRETFKEAGFDEMRRIIREEEPPRPSARIITMGKLATTVSDRRRSDPRKLRQSLRGELDWIVMKALEKNRKRRYETAGSFAADVQRYLSDEPVQACPPSAWYRFRKFARRHRVVVMLITFAALLLFVIVGALGNSTYLIWQEKERTQLEKVRAEANVKRALAVLDEIYLQLVERFPEEMEVRDQDREFFKKALVFYEELAEQNTNDPELKLEEGKAHRRVGSILYQLGRREEALRAHQRATEIVSGLAQEYPYRWLWIGSGWFA